MRARAVSWVSRDAYPPGDARITVLQQLRHVGVGPDDHGGEDLGVLKEDIDYNSQTLGAGCLLCNGKGAAWLKTS